MLRFLAPPDQVDSRTTLWYAKQLYLRAPPMGMKILIQNDAGTTYRQRGFYLAPSVFAAAAAFMGLGLFLLISPGYGIIRDYWAFLIIPGMIFMLLAVWLCLAGRLVEISPNGSIARCSVWWPYRKRALFPGGQVEIYIHEIVLFRRLSYGLPWKGYGAIIHFTDGVKWAMALHKHESDVEQYIACFPAHALGYVKGKSSDVITSYY